ncbi:putative ATP-binding cassette G family transporter [Besnoitia besnoiti]|uniref:Putative ATP-binding cassette G family transporter n=1 Tax=Besnoitia besnoiti TaxID=94643 RepID=A0A2A9MPF6_BESBE|nr:putative ATP-binding cassette G family transporter [Besnoitia besnoiti]PFH38226.1 putative ATP-binding cassette G family transporter [Besnoitia besnoiti]
MDAPAHPRRGRHHASEPRRPARDAFGSPSAFAKNLHVTAGRPITLLAQNFSYAVRQKKPLPCVPTAHVCLPATGAGASRRRADALAGDEAAPAPAPTNGVRDSPDATRRRDSAAAAEAECGADLESGARARERGQEPVEQGRQQGRRGAAAAGLEPAEKQKETATGAPGASASSAPLKVILSDIDLYAKPGEMLVIMGPSGSGKTTLLNALAGRSPPSSRVVQGGSLTYIGLRPGEPLSAVSTYVMQKDKVPELLTVMEYVTFFSRLKMKDANEEERAERVEVVLRELGLWSSRFTRVGGSAQKGLSGGEVKRLALAVELLHNPSLIFLDEPTSGLDAALAFETMKLLLRLARQGGRTIVCTIHQPRSQLFAMFDRLILMFEGRIVYQGPARRCVSYFAKRGFHCPPQFNPADFILDLLNVTTLTGSAPLVCPQSEASLSAQSLLEAELEVVHSEENQRLQELKQARSASDTVGATAAEEGRRPPRSQTGAADEASDAGAAEPGEAAAEGDEQRTTTRTSGAEGPAASAFFDDDRPLLLAGAATAKEEEAPAPHDKRPWVAVPYARVHGGEKERGAARQPSLSRHTGGGLRVRRTAPSAAEESLASGGGDPARDGVLEVRKAVSVLSVASAAQSEMEGANEKAASGVWSTQATCKSGDVAREEDGRDRAAQAGLAAAAGRSRGFLDAEEQPGEIHRVLVDERDVKLLADFYAASGEREAIQETIDEILAAADPEQVKPGAKSGVVLRLLRQPGWSDWWREVGVLVQMGFLNLLRNPMSSLVQLGLNLLFGLIFGMIFYDIPGQGYSFDSGKNFLGCIFFLVSQLVFGPLDALVLFCEDREVFNRDTANGNYSPSAFFVAKSLANMPFQHGPLTCVMLLAYWMCGLYRDAVRFFVFLGVGQLAIFASTSLLFSISSASPRLAVAQAIAPIVLLILLLVSGFYIRADDIPAWIRWVKYLSPIYYGYVAVALNQFPPEEYWGSISNRELLESYGGITTTDIGLYVGLLALLGCVFRMLAFFSLKYMNRHIGLEA